MVQTEIYIFFLAVTVFLENNIYEYLIFLNLLTVVSSLVEYRLDATKIWQPYIKSMSKQNLWEIIT